jgi:valyl-tRNA synthetase
LGVTASVVKSPWPNYPKNWQNPGIEGSIERIQNLIRSVREVRNRYQIDNRTPLAVAIRCSAETASQIISLASFLTDIAGAQIGSLGSEAIKPSCAATAVAGDVEMFINLEGLIDPKAELTRTEKQIVDKQKQLNSLQGRLANADFIAKAPKELVETQKQQVAEWQTQLLSLEEVRQSLLGLVGK